MAFKSVRPRNVAVIVGVCALIASLLLYVHPSQAVVRALGWIAFVVASVLIWYGLERTGIFVLGANVFARMSSGVRIIVGIPLVLALAALGSGALWLAANAIAWLTSANAI